MNMLIGNSALGNVSIIRIGLRLRGVDKDVITRDGLKYVRMYCIQRSGSGGCYDQINGTVCELIM